MAKLSKEEILKGKEKRETLHLAHYDADVVIRPLSDGELCEVFAILGNVPLKSDGTPDTSSIDITKNFSALRLAASMGLVEPELTTEEVGDMRFGVPEYVGTKVLELSGIATGIAAKKKG
jgi:hypothetical protein